jgi:hypothetical protein
MFEDLVFSDVTLCNLVHYQRFEGAHFPPSSGDNASFRNFGNDLPHYVTPDCGNPCSHRCDNLEPQKVVLQLRIGLSATDIFWGQEHNYIIFCRNNPNFFI